MINLSFEEIIMIFGAVILCFKTDDYANFANYLKKYSEEFYNLRKNLKNYLFSDKIEYSYLKYDSQDIRDEKNN